MARKANTYGLLKNVEAFVKSVPIDPKSRKYKEWVKYRKDMMKAISGLHRVLDYIEIVKVPALKLPCGKIPQRQSIALVTPCLSIPIRQALLLPRPPLCLKALPRQLESELSRLKK
jgi:hypothetical protein